MPERDSESGASFWSGAVVRAATTRERIQSAGPASKRTLAEPGLQPGAKFAQSLCPPASSSKNWFESGIFRWTFLVRAEAEIIKPAFGWRSEKRSSVISTTRPWLVPPKCLHVSASETGPSQPLAISAVLHPQLFDRTAQPHVSTPVHHSMILSGINLRNRCNACVDVDEAQG